MPCLLEKFGYSLIGHNCAQKLRLEGQTSKHVLNFQMHSFSSNKVDNESTQCDFRHLDCLNKADCAVLLISGVQVAIVRELLLPPIDKSYIVCCQIYWILMWALYIEASIVYLSTLVFPWFYLKVKVKLICCVSL